MQKRLFFLVSVSIVLALALILVLVRQRVQRQRVLRPAATETAATPARVPPVEQWTAAFEQLEGEPLDELLSQIQQQHPDLYAKWSLGYLHARASGDARRFEPFLAKGNAFRELALYHRAMLADGEDASRLRMALITEDPRSMYRQEAIDDELAYLASNPQRLIALAEKLAPAAPTALRRDMSARIVEALAQRDPNAALTRGLALLRGGTTDDASDRAARSLDRPELIQRMTLEQRALLGEAFHDHRHYDRAIALLGMALRSAYSDELQFSLGRSYYGAEKYAEAQAAYLRGSNATKDPKQKATFLWHAARSAQLRGDDAAAERLMTATIAVKGTHAATLPALTQRLRTRLRQKRFAEAASDLALLRRLAPNDRALLEGSLAYAVGNPDAALSTLDSIPRALLNEHDEAEIAYWRGRALEARDPSAAVRSWLEVLRATNDTPFAAFARTRLAKMNLDRERALRDAQVRNLIAAKKFDLAKRLQTDRVHLSASDRAAQLQTLAKIYRELPAYRDVLELRPALLPRFPVKETDRATLLMAMGLHGEAEDEIERRWGLRPAREALTRSLALNRGGAARASIYAVETMMKSVPRDFHRDLLPPLVLQLLYPRYFLGYVVEDAKRFETDPALVLAIMREESRFDPRAKSQAAARGLLQFIITTARDIGRDAGLVDVSPEDLYDPRIVIRLGAKYISELSERFEGNRHHAMAAYNAGPNQVALWTRLQAAPGDDYFVTAISFDETKGYVRKVMGAWERYGGVGEVGERGRGRGAWER
ncbi:MAG TPA: transglycosylase SLT domain-containing protein [Thermoanaerobaculia bacterium]|nr:transglycosylase SLT domain-containing protein [Thermoanaerobaculia bacterium]